MTITIRTVGAAMLCTTFLAACGGGGGGGGSSSSSTSLSGTFSDSAVSGLTYVINGVSAKTDATGKFNYKSGDTITFKVGDIVLGSGVGKPFMSPVTLVGGASDETNTTVTNIAKFLQTVDDDNNTSNGIQLTTAIHTAAIGRSITFTQSTAGYDGDVAVTNAYTALTGASAAGVRAGVNDATARAHLRSTLFTAMAGTYSGSYTGSANGTFTFTVDNTGTITSGSISNTGGAAISGNVGSGGGFTSSNAGSLSGSLVTVGFTGTVSAGTATVSGTWSVTGSGYNLSGSFSGQK